MTTPKDDLETRIEKWKRCYEPWAASTRGRFIDELIADREFLKAKLEESQMFHKAELSCSKGYYQQVINLEDEKKRLEDELKIYKAVLVSAKLAYYDLVGYETAKACDESIDRLFNELKGEK